MVDTSAAALASADTGDTAPEGWIEPVLAFQEEPGSSGAGSTTWRMLKSEIIEASW